MTPTIKLFITGTDERVQEAYEEIYSTYIIDKNLVTKGTRDNMTLEFSGDRAVCMVPIFNSKDKDTMMDRAWYIISRWDVTSMVCNGLLVRDVTLHVPDDIPEGCIIGDDGEIWRTYKT
jgi:hypothetical protein